MIAAMPAEISPSERGSPPPVLGDGSWTFTMQIDNLEYTTTHVTSQALMDYRTSNARANRRFAKTAVTRTGGSVSRMNGATWPLPPDIRRSAAQSREDIPPRVAALTRRCRPTRAGDRGPQDRHRTPHPSPRDGPRPARRDRRDHRPRAGRHRNPDAPYKRWP